MRLEQLDKAVKGQFIWSKDPDRKPFYTDETYEGSLTAAVIVYIGVADMFNIDELDLCEHLSIQYPELVYKRGLFRSAMMEVRKMKNTVDSDGVSIYDVTHPSETSKRMYIKTGLVLNYIKNVYNHGYKMNLLDIVNIM